MEALVKPKASGAIELIDICWRHNQEVIGHSWQRMNGTMRQALMLAVESGMRFGIDDIRVIYKEYRGGYWMGDLEGFYRQAGFYRNPSAWQAFEAYQKRKPFLWKPAVVKSYLDRGHGQDANPPRLVVGAEFEWKGEKVNVTSFHDGDDPYLTACSREKVGGYESCEKCGRISSYPRDVFKRRHKITHLDLLEARHALQEAKAEAETARVTAIKTRAAA